jgi:hypothetical protein
MSETDVITDTSVLINFLVLDRAGLLARLSTITTEALMVLLIQHGTLSVEEADDMKLGWENNHRFRLKFSSFSERI